jgi:predicted phage terminase large subunit-like protein
VTLYFENNMRNNLVRASSLDVTGLSNALWVRERADAARYEDSFGDFIKAGWHHVGEPQPFLSNWHIDCLADHLAAVARRQIRGPGPLIFTMPPRHMKSRAANVFLPAWIWAQDPDPEEDGHGFKVRPSTLMGPGVKFAYLSYVQRLSNDHSVACRQLVESDWYQSRWGDRVKLNYKQKEQFGNFSGGNRRALSFSSITGFGADIIVVDDAHDIKNVESKVKREATLRVWDEVLPTRLNDPKTGMFIVIMQRSHERDLIGHILAKEFGGIHVCLPAEFESRHPYIFLNPKWPVPRETDSSNGSDGGPKVGETWRDFRNEGEPLWKSRFPDNELKRWSSSMTSHAAAGQLQQRPTAREGGLFKRVWFDNPVKYVPNMARMHLTRAWDLASASDPSADPDWTVGLLMARDPETSCLYILDVTRVRLSPGAREEKIVTTARFDQAYGAASYNVRIPQDPGAAGKFEAHHLVGLLQGYAVSVEPEQGSKENRADPFAAQCEHGMVRLLEAAWNQSFVEELCAFPNGDHDDQVDAASAAFRALVRQVQWFLA